MKITNIIFFYILFSVFYIAEAFAYAPNAGNVTSSIGSFFSKTNFEGSKTTSSAPILGGLALLADGDLGQSGGLEIGIFYMPKIYFRNTDNTMYSEKTELMHITMGYRYWWSDSFSTALAFYSGYSMGSPQVYHSDYAIGTNPDTSAQDMVEYGFDISLQEEVWTKDKLAFIIDARYAYSVTNKQNEFGDHYALLIALRYFIQGKQ